MNADKYKSELFIFSPRIFSNSFWSNDGILNKCRMQNDERRIAAASFSILNSKFLIFNLPGGR